MNPAVLSQYLDSLPLQKRARFLIRVAFELTVYAREYGVPSADQEKNNANLKRLCGANELQHNILSQAGLYLDGETQKVYPVDVFSEIIFQTAGHYGIASDLATAIRYVQQRHSKPPSAVGGQS